MIPTHQLSNAALAELATGAGDSAVVRELHEAQLSKHLMLLRRLAEEAASTPSPAAAAFQAGYELLSRVQRSAPDVVARLLGLPHIGSWAHDCLARPNQREQPDYSYLATVAVAAAVQSGAAFEMEVRVRGGQVLLPGLGRLLVSGSANEWIRLSSDGQRLRGGRQFDLACADLRPDDGSASARPGWQGTPLVRALADGQTWAVLLETADPHLDRYSQPMLTTLSAAETTIWRERIQSAWELLVRHHQWAAGPVAAGVPVLVPLVPRSDLDSATSPAAFGAIGTSLPPSAVSMAETLIHELQHIKLCGLMDMLPLTKPARELGFAPWREDPRPVGGILQGVYAFAAIVRFWEGERARETSPDDVLRASVLYERWRLAIDPVLDTLSASGALTPAGVQFVATLREQRQPHDAAPVPADAAEIAREVALDVWLTWQLRHTAVDSTLAATLAAAYLRGEPFPEAVPPGTWIENETRKVDSVARSRLLTLRYTEPGRYRRLSAADLAGLDKADILLIRGEVDGAAAAYRERLVAERDPADWLGLALVVHRLPAQSGQTALATRLPLLLETHACLAGQGIRADPLAVAAWFG